MKQKIKSRIYAMTFLVVLVTTFGTTSYLHALPDADQLTDHVEILLHVTADVTKRDSKGLTQVVSGVKSDLPFPGIISIIESDVESNLIPSSKKEASLDDWSFERMLSSASYTKKIVDEADYTAHDITNDFNSETVSYLAIRHLKAIASGTNTSIVVTFADSLSANISDSADVTNTTIFNKPTPASENWWWLLPQETTNSSRSFIINIELVNIHADEVYIYAMSSDMFDLRYATAYLDNSQTPVSLSVQPGSYGTRTVDSWSSFWQDLWSWCTDPEEDYGESYGEAEGWATADGLEDDLEEDWADTSADIDDTDDILDYNVTDMQMSFSIDTETAAMIYDDIKDKFDVSDSVADILAFLKDKYFRTVSISTDIKPEELDEDMDPAETADDVTNGIFAAIQKALGRVNTFALSLMNRTIDSVGHVNQNVAAFLTAKLNAFTDAGFDPWILLAVGLGILALAVLILLRIFRR